MKLLLVHPEDELLHGPWTRMRWDRIIDLGRSGRRSYDEAAANFGCQVGPIDDLRSGFDEIRRVRDLLACGLGRVTDSFGLDWWELNAIFVHSEIETTVLLNKFASTIGSSIEVHVSRACFQAEALRRVLGREVHVFPRGRHKVLRAGRYVGLLKKFPARQLVDIFWDKTDPGYQVRARWTKSRKPAEGAVVLLPTAYINVSRTALAYARSLPDTKFLLVATRRSGWTHELPPNVSPAWLRSYASLASGQRAGELRQLLRKWQALRFELQRQKEFAALFGAGHFDDVPDRLARGLEVRDAWRNVLEREPVQAVLCADDTNPYTHIPLLLAKERGLPTVACHHGALDGRYMFKRTHSDKVLVKGRMEEDYLVRVCGISRERVELGAPAALDVSPGHDSRGGLKPYIVFFSEPYEVAGGRARDFYRDVLPRLADLALKNNRELVIKLHPFESLAERKRYVHSVLDGNQKRITRVIAGPLQPDLLANCWFGVTVLSTLAVECALNGVPCFLCKWLECWPYGYIEQYSRFGAGILLESPEEIESVPELLRSHEPSHSLSEDFGASVQTERLEQLLGSRMPNSEVAVSTAR